MPRYTVSVAMRVWVDKEIIAPTEEQAKVKGKEKAQSLLGANGFDWVSGKVEVLGALNLSLLNKIPSD